VRWYPQQPLPEHFGEAQPRPVALVNESLARLHWPGRDPIGQRLGLLFSPPIEVVGVVGDVRHTGLADDPEPEVYLFDQQEPQRYLNVMIRTAGDPAGLAAGVRGIVASLDRELPIRSLRPMRDFVSDAVAQPRLVSVSVASFSAAALALTLAGVAGLVSFSVSQRTREVGVRLALGASPRDVLRLVMGQGVALCAAGVGLGLLASLGLTRVLEHLVFGISPTDPPTLGVAAAFVFAAASTACYLPARRVLGTDPLASLREE
jgi:hypothetical protein